MGYYSNTVNNRNLVCLFVLTKWNETELKIKNKDFVYGIEL